jgi:purine-binding chemotaxis protein CheW
MSARSPSARSPIDWEALRARLSATPAASDRQVQDVFRERAERLASRHETKAEDAPPVLAFRLARLIDEKYALPLERLAGVLPLANITAVPGGPAELVGVINHRGQVCSVVDLAALLGVPSNDNPSGSGYILLLRKPGLDLGLRVGPVEAVVRVSEEHWAPSEPEGFLRGLFSSDSGKLWLLDADAILSHPLLAPAASAGPRPPVAGLAEAHRP